ncbi:MAG: DUF1127 domain-containing protein [Alphaproteobacteria bacterium]|nr:DUF1127 domain-containing protein [Alphaproteobacteria bacterium]
MSSHHSNFTHMSGHHTGWSQAVSAVAAGVRDAAAHYVDRVHRNWVRSRTISALASLDDASLKDIGVPRGDIEGFVRDLERGLDPRRIRG